MISLAQAQSIRNPASGDGSVSGATLSISTAAGNCLVAVLRADNSNDVTPVLSTIADNGSGSGNTWVLPGSGATPGPPPANNGYISAASYNGLAAIAYVLSAEAVTQVTMTLAAAVNLSCRLTVLEFSGVPAGALPDGSASASVAQDSLTSYTTPAITTQAAQDLIVAIIEAEEGLSGVSAGWIMESVIAAYMISTQPGSYALTGTFSSGAVTAAAIMAIGGVLPVVIPGAQVRRPGITVSSSGWQNAGHSW